jgi:hypothetical protein
VQGEILELKETVNDITENLAYEVEGTWNRRTFERIGMDDECWIDHERIHLIIETLWLSM